MRYLIVLISIITFTFKLSAKNIDDVESYLNNINSFTANFLQLDSSGSLVEGKILISKPGKFKWDYTSQPIQIVSDGKTIIFYDKELEQSSFLDVEDSIASLLAEANIDLDMDLNIIEFITNENGTYITLSKPNKKDVKEMRLYFEHDPFAITKIDVLDYNNNNIEINFFDIEINNKISNSEFIILDNRFN
ncbi:outer-membrane lipoprotein carrier protein LolA [Rickettsiales bacterium]|nr:outer-membrane lipoprotein carrier protein LolA [Rickettsiales bacterium]